MLHCINISQFNSPISYTWTSGLSSGLAYYEQTAMNIHVLDLCRYAFSLYEAELLALECECVCVFYKYI